MKSLEIPSTTTAYSTTKIKTINSSSTTKKSNKKNSTVNTLLTTTSSSADFDNIPMNNSTLNNIHYSRPPTAASLRFARKLQKAEKSSASGGTSLMVTNKSGIKGSTPDGNNSSEDEVLKQLPGGANNNKLR